MKTARCIGNWFVEPFGSVKTFFFFLAFFLLFRVADSASTWWFLSLPQHNLSHESNPLARALFERFGFWGGALLHNVFDTIFVLLYVKLLFWCAMPRGRRAAYIFAASALCAISISSFVVALWNIGLLHPLYYSLIADIIPRQQHLLLFGLIVLFFSLIVGVLFLSPYKKEYRPSSKS